MKLATKTTIFFVVVAIIVTPIIVLYFTRVVGGIFREQITEDIRIIAEQSEGTYFVFLDGLKKRVADWSSDARITSLSKEILSTPYGTRERARLANEFATYVSSAKMPLDESVLLVELLDKNGIVIASTRPNRIGVDEMKNSGHIDANQFSVLAESSFGNLYVRGLAFDEDEASEPIIFIASKLFLANNDGKPAPAGAVLSVHFASSDSLAHALGVDTPHSENISQGNRLSRMALLETYNTSDIYLVDRNKTLVTPSRYASDVKLRHKVDAIPVRECVDNGNEINTEYDNYLGSRVIGSSMCMKDDGLTLIVEIQKDELYAPIIFLNRASSALGVVLAILGVIVSVFFIRRPLSHLNKVVATAKRVIDGDLNAVVDVNTKDEIGALASMFNTMIESIRVTQKELNDSKRTLEERTEILEKDAEEHKKQEQFLDESKRATLNLLEDSWKAKEELAQEGSKLQTVISSISDALVLIDGSYRILLINPSVVSMFGMPADVLLGQDLRSVVNLWKRQKEVVRQDIWPIEEALLTRNAINGTLDDNFLISTEKHPDKIPVVISTAPLGGVFPGAVVVFRDATKERELDDAKSGFISVASHQLRTPLTSIRWYAEMLLSQDAGPLNDPQKDFMNEIHGGAERLYQTVDLLLGISRVESGKMKSDVMPIDIGVFTGEIVKELKPQMDVKSLAVSVLPPDREPVIVLLDSLTLRQVILNLISNAIRYTNEHGLVEIKWWMGDEGREVVYMVHDNGIGIPEKERPHIFSKFFRAENARSQVPDGSGLGLALVKELVESWGGKIWFESFPGQGSTFFFTVPLTATKVADIS